MTLAEARRKYCPEKHLHLCSYCPRAHGVGNSKIRWVGSGAEGIPCKETTDHAHGLCFLCGKLTQLFTLQGLKVHEALVRWWEEHKDWSQAQLHREEIVVIRAIRQLQNELQLAA